MTGLRDAWITGKTLLLGVSVEVSLGEVSICISRLSEEVLPLPMWASSSLLKAEKNRREARTTSLFFLSLSELEYSSPPALRLQFLGLQTLGLTREASHSGL